MKKDLRPRRILVVDDEACVREYVRDVLASRGHVVDQASSCLDAVFRLFQDRYDVLILDLLFPDVSGLFLYEQARRISADLAGRTLFMTGCDESHPLVRKARETPAPILFKPFSRSGVLDLVEERFRA